MSKTGIILILMFLLVLGVLLVATVEHCEESKTDHIYEITYQNGTIDTIVSKKLYLNSRGCLMNSASAIQCGVQKFEEL